MDSNGKPDPAEPSDPPPTETPTEPADAPDWGDFGTVEKDEGGDRIERR